jgi:hypothetical protein
LTPFVQVPGELASYSLTLKSNPFSLFGFDFFGIGVVGA